MLCTIKLKDRITSSMQIDSNILIAYGGVASKFDKGAYVYHEGMQPHFFYQVVEGEIKVYSSNVLGKELIQGVFTAGQSFGEPPLLLQKNYPATAQATRPSVVMRLGLENFLAIMQDYPFITEKLLYHFAERLYNKASATKIWVSNTPEEKITEFLHSKKELVGFIETEPVPYTRQQIADYTGLRVETVIRTLRRMQDEGKVKIVDHKLYF